MSKIKTEAKVPDSKATADFIKTMIQKVEAMSVEGVAPNQLAHAQALTANYVNAMSKALTV